MSRYLFSWKIGGEAGFGIKSAGLTFAKMISRVGYEIFGYVEYPSLIRGGHNTYEITVSEHPIRSVARGADILVALNKEAVMRHSDELNQGSAIIYDKQTTLVAPTRSLKERNIKLLHVPLAAIAEELKAPPVVRNTTALGATQALLGLPIAPLHQVIQKTLGHKEHVLNINLEATKRGYEYVRKHHADIDFKIKLEQKRNNAKLSLTGNDAVALGALAAGLQFYAAYPMTPSSSILHYLASKASSQRIVVRHAEDEISVINMALGASHAGARSMIATSGGGFALMTESLGLAGLTETPLVIVEVQRPGPATGLPTWTEQADLRFVLHAAQGDFPRVILTPGDHEECFYLTAQAFNLADQYQLPVIILSDKYLGESDRTIDRFDLSKVTIDRGKAVMESKKLAKQRDYKRYVFTESGISPRSVPGQKGGIYLANSDEHDEYGYSSESADTRIAQMKKRAAKFRHLADQHSGITLYGNASAKITVVSWGSTKGPILDALAWLPRRYQKRVNFLHFHMVWPFPSKQVYEILSRSKKILLIENNSTAQLGGLIRQQTGMLIERKMLRYDGRPLHPIDIKERILHL